MVQTEVELATGTCPAFEATAQQGDVLFLTVSSGFVEFPAVSLVITGQKYIKIRNRGMVLLLHYTRKFISAEFQQH